MRSSNAGTISISTAIDSKWALGSKNWTDRVIVEHAFTQRLIIASMIGNAVEVFTGLTV